MIALSMVLRGHPMSLGGVFMMLSCFVVRVFWHVDVLWNRYSDSLNFVQAMNHWRIPRLPHQKLGYCGIPLNRSSPRQSGLPTPFAAAECAGFGYARTS